LKRSSGEIRGKRDNRKIGRRGIVLTVVNPDISPENTAP
jgi:hypothetical protein